MSLKSKADSDICFSSFNVSTNGDHLVDTPTDTAAENLELQRRRSEANQHVANYVSEQLELVRTRSNEVTVYEDEFEAQLDGK